MENLLLIVSASINARTGRNAYPTRLSYPLDVEVPDIKRVLFDEVAPGLNRVAH